MFPSSTTTRGNPPDERYFRIICLIFNLFVTISSFVSSFRLLNSRNSLKVSGYTLISTCLPVSAVPSSLLSNLADEPETKIFALLFSCSARTNRSHSLTFWISSRKRSGVEVGWTISRYASNASIKNWTDNSSMNFGSSKLM